MNTTSNAVRDAVTRYGTARKLAKDLGVRHPAISVWMRDGRVPPAKVFLFCKLTGARPQDVNPEFFTMAAGVLALDAVQESRE